MRVEDCVGMGLVFGVGGVGEVVRWYCHCYRRGLRGCFEGRVCLYTKDRNWGLEAEAKVGRLEVGGWMATLRRLDRGEVDLRIEGHLRGKHAQGSIRVVTGAVFHFVVGDRKMLKH